jgi:hypothetical protein
LIFRQYNYCDIEPSLVGLSELQSEINDIPARKTHISTERHQSHNALNLAETWGIGLQRAKATIACTTQRGHRSAILPLSRRYRANRMYSLKRLNSRFATDTLFADIKSLNQNTCTQIYSHKVGFSILMCHPYVRGAQ